MIHIPCEQMRNGVFRFWKSEETERNLRLLKEILLPTRLVAMVTDSS